MEARVLETTSTEGERAVLTEFARRLRTGIAELAVAGGAAAPASRAPWGDRSAGADGRRPFSPRTSALRRASRRTATPAGDPGVAELGALHAERDVRSRHRHGCPAPVPGAPVPIVPAASGGSATSARKGCDARQFRGPVLVGAGRARDAACVAAARIETHTAVLTFDGELVRKRKKAVRFPFVDLSTPERRLAACRDELDLNRRLAPDVYLRVDEIRDATGVLVDAEVVMRRLPDECCLATRVRAGADVTEDLNRIARLLAAFHTTAVRSPQVNRSGTPDGLRARWDADLDEWEPLARDVLGCPGLERERSLVRRYIAGRADLLTARVGDGHIVDGHGDLLAQDIFCLADGPRILDCLEFDPQLRAGDQLADAAFLAMDLESLGRPDLAAVFATAYQRLAGDHPPQSLLHVYVAQRAMVRSIVACLRVAQGDAGAVASARSHLMLCGRHLDAARPFVVVIGGAPGTGKSTLAARLARTLGWVHLRSDEVRRGVGAAGCARRGVPDEGRYTAELTRRTYAALMERAASHLRGGCSVILDATFGDARDRRAARRVADATYSDLVELECHAPADVVRERVRERERRQDDLSEAGPGVAEALRRRRTPWPQAHPIDTTLTQEAQLAGALRHIRDTPVPTDGS